MQTTGGATPLMYACQQCMEKEVLEILKKQPSAVKDRDRTLKTPLHYCAENPNTSCAEAVLKAAPDLVNAQDENGYCTLHLAVIAGNKPLIKLLIAKGADVNIHDKEGHSSVHWAIVSSEKEALEMIVRAGANPSTPDIHGGYPLHYAVQVCGSTCDHFWNFEDTVRVVETLLNFGVDVNVKDKDGRQPILWAASAGSADAVIHLISGGACVEAADKDGLTALHCAASRGHTATLETLITLCGANVDVIDGNGCSALFYSVTLGHADATELLLRLGADPNRQDRKGRTPAHCGAAKGQLETLRILQKHGGNLWMRNVKGDIPLHEAVASGRKDLVLWLLSQNSDAINLANNDGRCPLHIASMYNNTEMVKVLLDSKSLVNPIMRTSKGILMTPLNVALYKGHRSCGKYLQLHGGVPFSKVSKVEPASGFVFRVSPSDDMIVESNKEYVMSSQSKISKSRSSTDIQGNQEVAKAESADKKKVYRRRKKKKTSTANANDSDSNDSDRDLKVKSPDNRKNNDESEGRSKVKKVQLNTATVEKEVLVMGAEVDRRTAASTQQVEVSEEVAKVTKTKTESKQLQRNKSFNETKNVSDLSPEDFPPQMQAVNQLDVVIMEPDIDVSKSENENVELKSREPVDIDSSVEIAAVITVTDENRAEKTTKNEENNNVVIKPISESSPGREENNDVDIKPTSESSPGREENNNVDIKLTSESSPGKEEVIERDVQDNIKVEKEDVQQTGEKSVKGNGEKKANGSNRKSESSSKSVGSKSSDEGSGSSRKSLRSPKTEGGSGKKESNKKSNGGSETVEKHKKAANSKISKKSTESKVNEVKENSLGSETKTENEAKEEEKLKTEPEISPTEIPAAEGSNNEKHENSTESAQPESVPAEPQDVETKNFDHLTTGTDHGVEKELSSVTGNVEKEEKERKETSEIVISAEETRIVTEAEVNPVIVTEASDNPSEEKVVPENEVPVPVAEVAELEKKEEVEILSAVGNADEKNNPEDAESKLFEVGEPPREEIISHVIEKRSADFNQTQGEKPEDNSNSTTAEQPEFVTENKEVEQPTGNNSNEISRTVPSNSATAQEEGNTRNNPSKEAYESADEEEEPHGKKANCSEQKHFKTPRVSRLCRRNRDFKDDMNDISVTQLVQNTIRKYHMERGIFYQLLELKRYQIRSGKANEQVLVKRLADEYERSRVFLGMKPFSGLYKFKEFEKFLYDQLKVLNTRRSFIIPDVKSYDDIDALSGFLKKSRYKIINDIPQPEMVCTCITQRCHHSACAYTSVPCSAYITDLRRHRHHKPKRECFFPRIEQPPSCKSESQRYAERPATLELVQGSEKHVITLPQNSPTKGKRYYVTFTIKGVPAFNNDDFPDDPKDFLKHRHSKSV